MARENISRNRIHDPRFLKEKLDEHDTALDALDTTGTLPADSVSNAELRNSGALSVIGRSANSTGDPADIQATAASDAVMRESGSTIGFGTVATGGIADAAVTRAKLSNGSALSVIGRSANSSGVPADIAASAASGAVLRESGSTIGFGTVATAGIADAAVTGAKLSADIRGPHQSLSGAGAINLTTPVTRYTSTGAAQALTLADGTVDGQRKRIIHVVDGGSGVLTAGGSLHLGNSLSSITLANLWDWVELEWQTNAWFVVAWAGAGVVFA
jgi:hypothetical protein